MNEKPAGETGHEDCAMDESSRHKGLDDNALRALLRRGDPAGDGRDPAPGEIAAWRQTMLAEARGRSLGRGRFLWQGALATAGLVLLAVLIIPFLRPSPEVPPAPEIVDRGEPVAADTAAKAGPDLPTVTAGDPLAETIETAPYPDDIPARAGDAALAAAAAYPARTIQFTAPGGTRIIWKLDPGFTLPKEGDKT